MGGGDGGSSLVLIPSRPRPATVLPAISRPAPGQASPPPGPRPTPMPTSSAPGFDWQRWRWHLLFLGSAVLGPLFLEISVKIDDPWQNAHPYSSQSPPADGLAKLGGWLVFLAVVIAFIWFCRVLNRYVVQPMAQEVEIATNPLPPVQLMRHPDGRPLSYEEQLMARYQMEMRQAQARRAVAAMAFLVWLNHDR